MNNAKRYLSPIGTTLLGLIFLVFGLNGFLHFIPMEAQQGTLATFTEGLAASGYFFPLLKGTEVIVGLALLSRRFLPLALTVLAPISINILAVHLFLAPAGLPMAIVIVALHIALAYEQREAFRPLLRAGHSDTSAKTPADRAALRTA